MHCTVFTEQIDPFPGTGVTAVNKTDKVLALFSRGRDNKLINKMPVISNKCKAEEGGQGAGEGWDELFDVSGQGSCSDLVTWSPERKKWESAGRGGFQVEGTEVPRCRGPCVLGNLRTMGRLVVTVWEEGMARKVGEVERSGDAEMGDLMGRVSWPCWAQCEGRGVCVGDWEQQHQDWVLGERRPLATRRGKGRPEAGDGSSCDVRNNHGSARRQRGCLGRGGGEQSRKRSCHLLPGILGLEIAHWAWKALTMKDPPTPHSTQ